MWRHSKRRRQKPKNNSWQHRVPFRDFWISFTVLEIAFPWYKRRKKPDKRISESLISRTRRVATDKERQCKCQPSSGNWELCLNANQRLAEGGGKMEMKALWILNRCESSQKWIFNVHSNIHSERFLFVFLFISLKNIRWMSGWGQPCVSWPSSVSLTVTRRVCDTMDVIKDINGLGVLLCSIISEYWFDLWVAFICKYLSCPVTMYSLLPLTSSLILHEYK